jgi:hypothetical protein
MLRHRVLAVAILVMSVGLSACGGGSETPSTPSSIKTPSAEERGAIEMVLKAHFAASTPEAACATITRGYESVIEGHGAAPTVGPEEGHGPASPNCPNVIKKAVKDDEFDLKPVQVTVGKVLVQRDLAAALVQEPNQERKYYLAQTSQGWRINNVTTAPPDYRELEAALKQSP